MCQYGGIFHRINGIMASSNQPSARFRSATEFPKNIEHLDSVAAGALYVEMRDCLIFTNRSRSQLIRRNEEHKQTALSLKTDVARLQNLINQLRLEKEQLTQSNQAIVAQLEQEIGSMSKHLDGLSAAFEGVAEFEVVEQTHWGLLAMPNRFLNFLRAVRAIVLWWRDEQSPELKDSSALQNAPHQLPGSSEMEQNRKENPQMYTDQASINRSLLDQ